jgi:hypothetical protein
MDFHAQLGFLRDLYSTYMKTLRTQRPKWAVDESVDMSESFNMLISQCEISMRWARQYHERTNIRIGLVSNTVMFA